MSEPTNYNLSGFKQLLKSLQIDRRYDVFIQIASFTGINFPKKGLYQLRLNLFLDVDGKRQFTFCDVDEYRDRKTFMSKQCEVEKTTALIVNPSHMTMTESTFLSKKPSQSVSSTFKVETASSDIILHDTGIFTFSIQRQLLHDTCRSTELDFGVPNLYLNAELWISDGLQAENANFGKIQTKTMPLSAMKDRPIQFHQYVEVEFTGMYQSTARLLISSGYSGPNVKYVEPWQVKLNRNEEISENYHQLMVTLMSEVILASKIMRVEVIKYCDRVDFNYDFREMLRENFLASIRSIISHIHSVLNITADNIAVLQKTREFFESDSREFSYQTLDDCIPFCQALLGKMENAKAKQYVLQIGAQIDAIKSELFEPWRRFIISNPVLPNHVIIRMNPSK